MQNVLRCWKNCNLQFFLVNYMKYYTLAIFRYKLLIYISFSRAWISVNQGFFGEKTQVNARAYF